MIFIYYKSKKLKGSVGMGEAVDTIPLILNKCLFVSPERREDGRTDNVKTVYPPPKTPFSRGYKKAILVENLLISCKNVKEGSASF